MALQRGDIWMHRFAPPDKQRPVVVLTRAGALPHLRSVTVAPVTSTIRGMDSEVVIGPDEGLKRISVVNLDNVQTVDQRQLRHYVGHLDHATMQAVCRALAVATGCD